MGSIAMNFKKKLDNRDLGDYFNPDKEEEHSEVSDADLEQYDEMDYIN